MARECSRCGKTLEYGEEFDSEFGECLDCQAQPEDDPKEAAPMKPKSWLVIALLVLAAGAAGARVACGPDEELVVKWTERETMKTYEPDTSSGIPVTGLPVLLSESKRVCKGEECRTTSASAVTTLYPDTIVGEAEIARDQEVIAINMPDADAIAAKHPGATVARRPVDRGTGTLLITGCNAGDQIVVMPGKLKGIADRMGQLKLDVPAQREDCSEPYTLINQQRMTDSPSPIVERNHHIYLVECP